MSDTGSGPVEVDIIVEVPQGSRNKYEYDPVIDAIRLDRMLFTSTRYPHDYGFIPGTLAEDGDPLDAMVILDEPTFPGCEIAVRPIAVFWMTDEKGPDAKILMVPARDPRYAGLQNLSDVLVSRAVAPATAAMCEDNDRGCATWNRKRSMQRPFAGGDGHL